MSVSAVISILNDWKIFSFVNFRFISKKWDGRDEIWLYRSYILKNCDEIWKYNHEIIKKINFEGWNSIFKLGIGFIFKENPEFVFESYFTH